ncbi:hypothetical protein AC249_AIPGENE9411 [Exaiptasia diaphana]|nr:hypothetical protein AC249_AIPGENE9411 [Exaiptasia diaphana]
MPEIAEKKKVYDKLMGKSHQTHTSKSEEINDQSYVIGGMTKNHIEELDKELRESLEAHGHPIGDSSGNLNVAVTTKVTVRNNYTALTEKLEYVSIDTYVKVINRCTKAQCTVQGKCSCDLLSFYYMPVISPTIHKQAVIKHIFKVQESKKLNLTNRNWKMAVPINALKKKVLRIDVASGSYISLIPNLHEKD